VRLIARACHLYPGSGYWAVKQRGQAILEPVLRPVAPDHVHRHQSHRAAHQRRFGRIGANDKLRGMSWLSHGEVRQRRIDLSGIRWIRLSPTDEGRRPKKAHQLNLFQRAVYFVLTLTALIFQLAPTFTTLPRVTAAGSGISRNSAHTAAEITQRAARPYRPPE
jgi:hypothetical protein